MRRNNLFRYIGLVVFSLSYLVACDFNSQDFDPEDFNPQDYPGQEVISAINSGNVNVEFSHNHRPYKKRVRITFRKPDFEIYLDAVSSDLDFMPREVKNPACPVDWRNKLDKFKKSEIEGRTFESSQLCGTETRQGIYELVVAMHIKGTVTCTYDPETTGTYFDRQRKRDENYAIGRCYMDGKDIALDALKKGLVRVNPIDDGEPHFIPEYREVEAKAKENGTGLWGKCCIL